MSALAATRRSDTPSELPQAASPDALTAWIESASPGSQVIYASGADLPVEAAGVRLVAEWIAAKRVHPLRQRDPRNPARWNFLAVKSGGRESDTSVLAAVTPKHAVNRVDMGRMLRLLRQIAARGEPCPSHRELSRMLGLKHRHAARYLLTRLVEDGKIALDAAPDGARVLRVLGLKQRSGRPDGDNA